MSIIENAIKLAKRQSAAPADTPVTRGTARARELRKVRAADPARPTVSWDGLAGTGVLATERPLLEQFRHLKRPVLRNAFGELAGPQSNVVMISSAIEGAGKTFVAINLANALALERDREVCLIDLDNIRGSLSSRLSLTGCRGFFDVVDDAEPDLTDVMVATSMPGLTVIPSGSRFSDSSELLNSSRARELVRALADDNPGRIIILDTPPILSTADAHVILALADQLLIVVSAGETKAGDLHKLLATIETDKPIGMVFNRAPHSRWLTEYGGYYYDAPPPPAGGKNHG